MYALPAKKDIMVGEPLLAMLGLLQITGFSIPWVTSFDWGWLGAGVGLILATVFILGYLRHVVANSVIGIIAWAICVYVFQWPLPFLPSLIVSAFFGLAGIGALILVKMLGLY